MPGLIFVAVVLGAGFATWLWLTWSEAKAEATPDQPLWHDLAMPFTTITWSSVEWSDDDDEDPLDMVTLGFTADTDAAAVEKLIQIQSFLED